MGGEKALKCIPGDGCALQERQPPETVRGNPFLPGSFLFPGGVPSGAGPASWSVSVADPPHPPGVSSEILRSGVPRIQSPPRAALPPTALGGGTPGLEKQGSKGMVGEKPQCPPPEGGRAQ